MENETSSLHLCWAPPRACYLVVRAHLLSLTSVHPCLAPCGQQALGGGSAVHSALSFLLLLQRAHWEARWSVRRLLCLRQPGSLHLPVTSLGPREQHRLLFLSAQLLLLHPFWFYCALSKSDSVLDFNLKGRQLFFLGNLRLRWFSPSLNRHEIRSQIKNSPVSWGLQTPCGVRA